MAESSGWQKTATSSDGSRGSLISRIGASTSALVRDTILQPQPEHVGESLATISSSSSKGSPSSGLTKQLSVSQREISENRSVVSGSRAGSLTETFRTYANEASSSNTSLQHEFDIFGAVSARNPARVLRGNGTYNLTRSDHGEQRSSWVGDGAEVVALLSDPNFSVDELPDPFFDAETFNNCHELLKSSDINRTSLSAIGKGLITPPVHQTPSPTNSLNLLPNFDFGDDVASRNLLSTSPVALIGGENRRVSRPPTDLLSTNFESWLVVLTRYQDDVWGDMLPLVEEARAEMKIASAEGGAALIDRPAIRRLSMILRHVNEFSDGTHL